MIKHFVSGIAVLFAVQALLALSGSPGRADDAASCPAVRLDGAGGSMEHVEPFDQAQVGNCYDVTASEMYDAWRFKHGDTQYYHRTSPFFAFIKEKTWLDRPLDTGGNTSLAMSVLKHFGSCNNNDLFHGLDGQKMNDYLIDVNQWWKFYQRMISDFHKTQEDTPYNRHSYGLDMARTQAKNEILCQMRRHAIPVEVIQAASPALERALDDGSLSGFYEKWLSAQCSAPDKTKQDSQTHVPDLKSVPLNTMNDLTGTVTRSLSQGLPLSLSFCSQVFDEPAGGSYSGVTRSGGKINTASNCGGHAVPIIGRQFRNGKCMLLLRNSWGLGCNGYHSTRRGDCEQGKGDIWLSQDEAFRNGMSLEVFP